MSARIIRATTALIIGGGLVVGGSIAAAPAMADNQKFTTSRQEVTIDNQVGDISDSESIVGPGLALGWTEDAFDSDTGEMYVRVCGGDYRFGTEYTGVNIAAPGVTSAVVDNPGGTSSYVVDWSLTTADCGTTNVKATVTLQGSYIRWAYAFSGFIPDTAVWNAEADAGSRTTWIFPSASTAVAYSTNPNNKDTTLSALKFASAGSDGTLTTNRGQLTYTVTAPTSLTAIVALADASPQTGYDEAVQYLSRAATTLDETFGDSLPIFMGTDAPAYTEQELVLGKAVEGTADYTYAFLDVSLGDETPEEYFATGPTGYTLDGEIPGVDIKIVFDPNTGQPTVTYEGTPTVAGTFNVPITYYKRANDRFAKPLTSILSFVVTDPSKPVTPADGGNGGKGGAKLAETGVDGSPFVGGAAALLMFGAMTLLVARRRSAGV